MKHLLSLIFLLISSAAMAQYQPPPVLRFPLPPPPINFGVGDIQLLTNAINQIANSAVIGPFTPGHLISGGPSITQIQDSGKTPSQVSALSPLNSAGTIGDVVTVGPGTSQVQDSGKTPSQVSALAPLNAAGTLGDLTVIGPGTSQVQDSSTCTNGLCSTPSGISYTGNLSYAGTATPAWFKVDGLAVSGTSTSSSGCCLGLNVFRLYLGSDTVNATTPGTLSEMAVIDAPAAGHSGFRTAITGYVETVGSPGAGNNNYVGVLGQNRANVNLGGTTFSSYSAGTNQFGSLFGMNANVFAQSGATFLVNITSEEFDVSLPSGASSAEKHGITIIKSAADAVQGNFDDSAIEFDDQDGTSIPWNYGISFGAYAHKWSFDSTSTLIGIQNRVVPSPATSPANIGVDMTNGTFTTAQYKGTNFAVTPSGNIALSANGGFVAIGRSTAINTGDMIAASFTNGNRAGATFTNASSATTATTTISLGNSTTASGKATISLNGGSFSGGQGANALQITNTSTDPIVIGTGTEVIKFGSSGAFTANGTSSAVTLTAVTPAAVTSTTIAKWLTITDNAGNVDYIPVWH